MKTFKTGLAGIKADLEQAAARQQRGNSTTNWFGWKAGETKIIRFLTDGDEVIRVLVHEQVPAVNGKTRTFVCRSEFDVPCELCDAEPRVYRRELGYGVAVLREEVYEDVDGKKQLTGYRDWTEEYSEEVDGKTVKKKRPYVGIVSQGKKNFWSPVALVYEKRGSLKSYDIEIARQGAGTDTNYIPFPLDPKPIENIDTRYEKFFPDIKGMLQNMGSEAYYARHLHGVQPEKKESSGTSTYEQEYEEEAYEALEEETEAERLKKKLAEL